MKRPECGSSSNHCLGPWIAMTRTRLHCFLGPFSSNKIISLKAGAVRLRKSRSKVLFRRSRRLRRNISGRPGAGLSANRKRRRCQRRLINWLTYKDRAASSGIAESILARSRRFQRFPRRACSSSSASNRALKLPTPNPRLPCRRIISKKTVGRSCIG
jgi:hypothetical protein